MELADRDDDPNSHDHDDNNEDESTSGLGSDEDDISLQHVWCKGEKCTIEYREDGNLYDAKIRHIFKNEKGRMMALVSYLGFSSDNDEEVEVTQLQLPAPKSKKTKSPSLKVEKECEADTSIFKPLRGDEEKTWLETKFQELEDEESRDYVKHITGWGTSKKTLVNKVNPTGHVRKKKMMVATGGQPKGDHADSSNAIPSKRVQVKKIPSARTKLTTDGDSSDSDNHDHAKFVTGTVRSPVNAGFSETDMEKPNLGHPPCGTKEPYVLSEQEERPVIQVPAPINQYLRDYQRDGVRFLYSHFRRDGGAILGDDMGLGKTVQVIAFMSAILRKTGTRVDVMRQKPRFIRMMSDGMQSGSYEEKEGEKKTFLIIGPASVLYNWIDELETWGHFTVGKYHKNYKEQTMSDLKRGKLDVVVTTFETCRDNIDELNTYRWTGIIADEAHKIKGLKAETTQALKKLFCLRRFGLTGTALQNQLKELWCILDWANPGCLGNVKQFQTKYEKVIEKGQRHDATKRELADARKAKEKFSVLKNQWMIRRTKAIIAHQLPKKEERVIYCRPTEFQKSVYKAILNHKHMKLIFKQSHPCDCHSGRTRGRCCYQETSDGQTVQQLTFTFMHLLLKTANHVALLMPHHTQSEAQRERAEELCQVAFASHPQFVKQTRKASFRTLSDPKYCGKMKVLQGLLSVFRKDKNKILLFSLSTQLLDILEQYVISMGYEFLRLDGKTPDIKRVQLVRQFNKDPNIFLFLVSTRAGGVGLNMTGANIVIIFDPNWNPTHDLQAQDRAYRIGQGRDVRVFRLICSGTIEENIYLRQIYKQQLDHVAVGEGNAKRYFHGVQGNKKLHGELFGIENLFQLRTGDRCLTADILQRNDKIEAGLRGFQIENYIPSSYELAHAKELQAEENYEDLESSNDEDGEREEDPYRDGYSDSDSDTKPQKVVYKRKEKKSKDAYGLDYFCSQVLGFDELHDLNEEELAHQDGRTTERATLAQNARPYACSDSDSDIPSGQRPNTRYWKNSDPQPSSSGHYANQTDMDAHPAITFTTRSPGKSFSGRSSDIVHAKSKIARVKDVESTRDRQYGEEYSDPYKSNVTEKPKKGKGKGVGKKSKVTFQESSSDDNQLDALDQSLGRVTFESVSEVFKECGVVHMHENQKITGASRAEDHMSRCAVQDVFELHQHSQAPAVWCEQLDKSSSSSESDDLGEANRQAACRKPQSVRAAAGSVQLQNPRKSFHSQQSHCPRAEVIGNKKVLIGQTPKGIRKLQFSHMALALDKAGPINLARHILFSSTEAQEEMLRQFYLSQDPGLEPVFRISVESEGVVDKDKPKTVVRGKKRIRPEVKHRKKPQRRTKKNKRGIEYSSESEETVSEDDAKIQPVKCSVKTRCRSQRGKSVQERNLGNTVSQTLRRAAAQQFEDAFNEAFGIGEKSQDELEMAKNKKMPLRKDLSSQGKTVRQKPSKVQDSVDDLLEDMGVCSENVALPQTVRNSVQMMPKETMHVDTELKSDNILDDIFSDNGSQSKCKYKQPPKRTPPGRDSIKSRKKLSPPDDDIFDFLHSNMQYSRQKDSQQVSSNLPNDVQCDTEFDIFDLDAKIKSPYITNKTEHTSPQRQLNSKSVCRNQYQSDIPSKKRPCSDSESEEDFFLDTSKWTKRKSLRHRYRNMSSQESIDTMISEDDKLYNNLFKTGKLAKKS